MEKLDFKSRNNSEQWLALALVALGVVFRLAPHPENVTPVAAIALFAGVTLSPVLAFTVPVTVMMTTDLFIGWLVWPTFLLVTWIGQRVRGMEGALPIALASFGSSVLFFAVTNLGVFFFENLYAKTWTGLAECFTMALPFFRNSLIGDLGYTAVFFTLFALARRGIRVLQRG